ncbi:MAG: WD40/YVTN/BNR-like repeat-containing protein, partial [Dehalococcoidia bacterium]
GPTEERGIYRTTDGGKNWDNIRYVGETAGAADLAMDPTNPRILYAAFWDHLRTPWEIRSGGEGSGIEKTTDGGDTWETLGKDPDTGFPELKGKMSIAVSADPDRLYALVEADPGGGLYRSDDAGKTWTLVNETWTIRARAWYYIKVFADPHNPDVVWVTNSRLLKSIDGGKTFTRVAVPHGDNHHVWIHPENSDIMINSNDGGANISYNGGKTWSTQRNQPTGQFYRVNVDHRFPYYVYGGQQDNSTVAIASQTFGRGIGWKDWYSVGGCESAYTAFDRDDPVLVYAGCYMGQISEWDARTRSSRSVMAYPTLPAALASRDMKYRFNWNAPIVSSHHGASTIYHGSNILLKTEDGGVSWTEVSPDLTRDDDEKQGPGGGPITNEGAGGEIYGTLAYVAESPHDAGVIWTGSDDGLVHVTKDGGANWSNVTPPGIGEALINAIEVSPHEPAAAYIAVTKYKFNDFTPLAYKTDDYGASWTRITDGIADEAWVRVVREDPKRRGLLYMGTETGMYVSFDDGERWQSLQLNLPVSPITDLIVQGPMNDLVAATSGRSFWILDDLSPLQQGADDDDIRLFEPRPAYRVQAGGGFGSRANLGANPPRGAILDFMIDDAGDDTTATLEVFDEAGVLVRSY